MVIKDVERPEMNFRLLVEEQRLGNVVYQISDSYAPSLDNVNKKISIAIIDEKKTNDYKTVHGLDLSDGKISSYNLILDKKESSHDGYYLDDPMEYYEEVIEAFEKLINSDSSEFTSKALEVFKDVKSHTLMIGSGKNAL